MKARTLLMLLLVCVAAIGAEETQVLRPETKWQPIFGYKDTYSKAYADVNSFERTTTEKGEYVSGAILIVSNKPVAITVEGKQVVVRSIVKHMVVDCSTKYMLPAMDFYFDVEKPTRLNKPVAGFEYPTKIEGAEVLSRSSLIYTTFCPVYI